MVKYRHKTIHPGELYVSRVPCEISTLLGSCVSLAIYNPKQKAGGLNHYMLPRPGKNKNAQEVKKDYRYGNIAIKRLIDKMLVIDPDKSNLVVKMFGGGMVVDALKKADIGKKNVELARQALKEYGLKISKEYVRKKTGLKIIFDTHTGKVLLKRISDTKVAREEIKTIETMESRVTSILSSDTGIDLLGNGVN